MGVKTIWVDYLSVIVKYSDFQFFQQFHAWNSKIDFRHFDLILPTSER